MIGSKPAVPAKKSNETIAQEVIQGLWGNGDTRKKKLTAAGYDYNAIQSIVNRGSASPKKSVNTLAKEVIQGKWDNGAERRKKLTAAGYNYDAVQAEVNRIS